MKISEDRGKKREESMRIAVVDGQGGGIGSSNRGKIKSGFAGGRIDRTGYKFRSDGQMLRAGADDESDR